MIFKLFNSTHVPGCARLTELPSVSPSQAVQWSGQYCRNSTVIWNGLYIVRPELLCLDLFHLSILNRKPSSPQTSTNKQRCCRFIYAKGFVCFSYGENSNVWALSIPLKWAQSLKGCSTYFIYLYLFCNLELAFLPNCYCRWFGLRKKRERKRWQSWKNLFGEHLKFNNELVAGSASFREAWELQSYQAQR